MWKVALGVAALGVVALGVYETRSDPCSKRALYEEFKGKAAIQLKSPSTASFQKPDGAVIAHDTGGAICSITISGWVDSQNSFGATVRSRTTGKVNSINGRILVSASILSR
jgi:hypothetical protein